MSTTPRLHKVARVTLSFIASLLLMKYKSKPRLLRLIRVIYNGVISNKKKKKNKKLRIASSTVFSIYNILHSIFRSPINGIDVLCCAMPKKRKWLGKCYWSLFHSRHFWLVENSAALKLRGLPPQFRPGKRTRSAESFFRSHRSR